VVLGCTVLQPGFWYSQYRIVRKTIGERYSDYCCGPIRDTHSPFDLDLLQRVVVSESSKAYLTKQVDQENKNGLFAEFKQLTQRFSELIEAVAPKYPYPHSLASLFIESQLNQRYFADHLPSLTDLGIDAENRLAFYQNLVQNTTAPWKS